MTSEIVRELTDALKAPDIFVREATGEKYLRVGKRLVSIKGIAQNGRPIFACDSEQKPNAAGGQDVVVRPQAIRCEFGVLEPGELTG